MGRRHSNILQGIVGVGGSATVDGGAGVLEALGAKLLDAQGRPLPRGGGFPRSGGFRGGIR